MAHETEKSTPNRAAQPDRYERPAIVERTPINQPLIGKPSPSILAE